MLGGSLKSISGVNQLLHLHFGTSFVWLCYKIIFPTTCRELPPAWFRVQIRATFMCALSTLEANKRAVEINKNVCDLIGSDADRPMHDGAAVNWFAQVGRQNMAVKEPRIMQAQDENHRRNALWCCREGDNINLNYRFGRHNNLANSREMTLRPV